MVSPQFFLYFRKKVLHIYHNFDTDQCSLIQEKLILKYTSFQLTVQKTNQTPIPASLHCNLKASAPEVSGPFQSLPSQHAPPVMALPYGLQGMPTIASSHQTRTRWHLADKSVTLSLLVQLRVCHQMKLALFRKLLHHMELMGNVLWIVLAKHGGHSVSNLNKLLILFKKIVFFTNPINIKLNNIKTAEIYLNSILKT